MPVNSSGEHFVQNGLQEGRNLHALEQTLGYKFQDQSLLRQALTHPSCDGEVNYERLEFLGDAVIELVVSEMLFRVYPKAAEGDLSQKRAAIVCTAGLADLAQSLSLGDYLVLGKAEVKSQGRRKLKILEDAMEAVLGAIYADSGYGAAREVAIPLFEERVAHVGKGMRSDDYKSQFQELVQAQGKEKIEYVMTDQYGPPHEPTFEVALTVAGRPLCTGTGSSKKRAEQQAAKYAVEHFRALYDTLEGRPVESAHMQHKDAQELDSIMRLDDVDMFGWTEPAGELDDWSADPVQEVYDLTIEGDPVPFVEDGPSAADDISDSLALMQLTLDGDGVPVAEVLAAQAAADAARKAEAAADAEALGSRQLSTVLEDPNLVQLSLEAPGEDDYDACPPGAEKDGEQVPAGSSAGALVQMGFEAVQAALQPEGASTGDGNSSAGKPDDETDAAEGGQPVDAEPAPFSDGAESRQDASRQIGLLSSLIAPAGAFGPEGDAGSRELSDAPDEGELDDTGDLARLDGAEGENLPADEDAAHGEPLEELAALDGASSQDVAGASSPEEAQV